MISDITNTWVPSMRRYIDEEALMKLIQRQGYLDFYGVIEIGLLLRSFQAYAVVVNLHCLGCLKMSYWQIM